VARNNQRIRVFLQYLAYRTRGLWAVALLRYPFIGAHLAQRDAQCRFIDFLSEIGHKLNSNDKIQMTNKFKIKNSKQIFEICALDLF